jgi:hypothetical protein
MPILRCPTPADTAAALARVRGQRGAALFLFFGSADPETGQSWCADCVTADPVLRSACARLRPELALHECPVGPRSAWKNQPGHPYRQDGELHLERIPTLVRYVDGLERGRLVEADCAVPERVAAFLGD